MQNIAFAHHQRKFSASYFGHCSPFARYLVSLPPCLTSPSPEFQTPVDSPFRSGASEPLLSEEYLESLQEPVLKPFIPAETKGLGNFEGASYCESPSEQELDGLFGSEAESLQQPPIPAETETLDRTASFDISNNTASDTVNKEPLHVENRSSLPLDCETSPPAIPEPQVQYSCGTCSSSFKHKWELK